ncbi:MAG: type II toxin-antitoxin system RelE/ParE family toxin [Lachnospiraceae bacterium]|nr:type II toxin-antitoxin system RelE/ParE family toxin [Lachnospiraceae bacterium]
MGLYIRAGRKTQVHQRRGSSPPFFVPSFKSLHQISSVRVNGNWRLTFYSEELDAYLVDYIDYH